MQNHFGAVRSEERYSVDADLLREIKQVCFWAVHMFLGDTCSVLSSEVFCNSPLSFQHLKQQQEGISRLISVIKDDLEDIKLIEHGLSDGGHMRGGILSWAHVTIRTHTVSAPKDVFAVQIITKPSGWLFTSTAEHPGLWHLELMNVCGGQIDCKYVFVIPFNAAVDTLLNLIHSEGRIASFYFHCCGLLICICLYRNLSPHLISKGLELIGFMSWIHILARLEGWLSICYRLYNPGCNPGSNPLNFQPNLKYHKTFEIWFAFY